MMTTMSFYLATATATTYYQQSFFEHQPSSGLSLYRKNDCYDSSLLAWNGDLERLLTPPAKVKEWWPTQSMEEAMDDLAWHTLREFDGRGITRDMIVHEKCEVYSYKCEGGIYVQYINGSLYVAPAVTREQCGDMDREQDEYRIIRRLHVLRILEDALLTSAPESQSIGDFEIWFQSLDAVPGRRRRNLSVGIATESHPHKNERSKQISLAEAELDIPSLPDWNRSYGELFLARKAYPWKERKPQAVFRGTTRHEPWQHLCYPGNGDEAAMSNTSLEPLFYEGKLKCGRYGLKYVAETCDPENLLNVQMSDDNMITHDKFMTMSQQEQFKYVLYVEGHVGWSDRLKWLLGMGNTIIKQVNRGIHEWYDFQLRPWVHYIPVDHLFNALPAVLQWARNHDDDVLQISKNADEYAKFFLNGNAFRAHTLSIFRRLSQLQRYSIDPLPDAVPLATARAKAMDIVRQTC